MLLSGYAIEHRMIEVLALQHTQTRSQDDTGPEKSPRRAAAGIELG